MYKVNLLNLLVSVIITISLLTSCKSNLNSEINPEYILSNSPEIIEFEKSDHRFCESQDLQASTENKAKNDLYWRCRLSLTKYRLKVDLSDPQNIEHNKKIGDIITLISLKLSSSPQMSLAEANKNLEKHEHNKCLQMGYELDTDDQIKIDDYFLCRKILIQERKGIPPFYQSEYINFDNESYNIGFIINQRLDEKIREYNEAKKAYPKCIIHKLSSQDFTNCTTAYDASRKCYSEIDRKKFNMEAQKKITCQRQSYIRFPENLIKQDDFDIDNYDDINFRSDYYNNNDFSSLGITDSNQFNANKDSKLTETKSSKKDIVDINSSDKLYSKFEITKLREKYIKLCQKNADNEILEYKEKLISACESLKKYKKVGE